jgi:signal peptidase I
LAVRIFVPLLFALSLWLVFAHVMRFGYVVSRSMEPTLLVGDYYTVRLHQFTPQDPPHRGDVIVFVAADGTPYVKRVIGLGGESLVVVGGNVFIGRQRLHEPYLKETPYVGPPLLVHVPDGTVYVMGDNRNFSEDSRDDGPVPLDQVMGRVTRVVWPMAHAHKLEPVDYGPIGGSPGQ